MWLNTPRAALVTGEDVLERLRTRLPGPLCGARADTPLADLPIDSLDTVELLCLIDDEFGVRFEQEQYQQMRTVGDLAGFVARTAPPSKGARS
jgi:acyl carrier protein